MSKQLKPPSALLKQRSWSPDLIRDEAWSRRKGSHRRLDRGRSKSVTDEDLDELKACFELGFTFDSPEVDPKLSDAFPALEFYYAVNRRYGNTLSRSSSSVTVDSDCDSSSSSIGGNCSIIDKGDDPETVKTRLRHWARVVACSVLQSSPG